ncbi:hypothetical protein FH039_08680 [Thermococcus indicus]|uniref:Uncharacterized protein n=1 Tax=Thermococcus indicus TaxID=2586643 RepID=A0A4Y5SL60_9EURY|nr:hypothetical protein [Thermococcus indicus]QDA31657.1 hypothetical protein FH039_08680 [Thermococcus indicus]
MLVGHCRKRSVGGDIFFVFKHSVMVFSISDYPAVRTFFGREAREYLGGLREFRGFCSLCLLPQEEAERLMIKVVRWFDEFEGLLNSTARNLKMAGIEKLNCDDALPRDLELQLKLFRVKLASFSTILPRNRCRDVQTGPEEIDGCLHVEIINERLKRLREP